MQKISYKKEWLTMTGYDFKILTMILAKGNVYRGNLKSMAEWLGVAAGDSRTNRQIKDAIDNLVESRIIAILQQGRTYTLTLEEDAEVNEIDIDLDWVSIAREKAKENKDISWETLLKVWLAAIVINDAAADYKTITKMTSVNTKQVQRGIAILADINALKTKPIFAKPIEIGKFNRIGTEITANGWVQ